METTGPAAPEPADGKDPRPPPGSDDVTTTTRPTTDPHAAFARWVEPEIAAMLRVAHTLTASWSDAEDVVQESLVRAFRSMDRFDGRHPRAWLFTIVRHTHLNSLRRTRPVLVEDRALHGRPPAFGPEQAASPEDLVADSTYDSDVADALAALNPRYREVVLLVDVDRLSYAEAAGALGVPVGTVMSRLSRARSRLRSRLEHRRPHDRTRERTEDA